MLIKTVYEHFNTFKESFFVSIDDAQSGQNVQTQTYNAPFSEDSNPSATKTEEHSDGTRGTLPGNVMIHPLINYCSRYGSIMLSGLDNFTDPSSVEETPKC